MAETRRPVPVYVTPAERRTLRRRAGGRPLSVYLRNLALGKRPGAPKQADDWWDTLAPGRKEQIHHWITAGRDAPPAPDGLEPFPELDALLG